MSEMKASVYNHTDALAGAITSLCAEGNLKAFTDAVKYMQKTLDLPNETAEQWIAKAEQEAPKIRQSLGAGLKEAAQKNGCGFEFRPPYISFGAVTFHERNPGTWELSIMDGVVIEALSTQNADSLATAALAKIKRIKDVLDKDEMHVKNLVAAYDWLQLSSTENRYVSPNLLMLLCTYGKGLRKQLTSAMTANSVQPLSRAEFSYLLARIHRRAVEGIKGFPKLAFRGAIHVVTKDPSRFISIPGTDDPCQIEQRHTPVVEIALDTTGE